MFNLKRKPSVFGGTMIIAGVAIGAGMLALPTISEGMWIRYSLGLLILTWLMMLLSGLFFALLLSSCVWWNTYIADRFSIVMIGGAASSNLNGTIYALLVLGCMVGVCHILFVFNLLPIYQ